MDISKLLCDRAYLAILCYRLTENSYSSRNAGSDEVDSVELPMPHHV